MSLRIRIYKIGDTFKWVLFYRTTKSVKYIDYGAGDTHDESLASAYAAYRAAISEGRIILPIPASVGLSPRNGAEV